MYSIKHRGRPFLLPNHVSSLGAQLKKDDLAESSVLSLIKERCSFLIYRINMVTFYPVVREVWSVDFGIFAEFGQYLAWFHRVPPFVVPARIVLCRQPARGAVPAVEPVF